MSVLNKTVSYFKSKSAAAEPKDVNLLELLQSDEHKESILTLRSQTDETIQKQLKDKLECYTPTGTFSHRCNEGLLKLSGIAPVDLDSAEDYDIPHLLKELKKIPYIAYTGLSCRGKRLFCLIPFKYPDKYSKHYERLIQSFNDIGLSMGDECHKAISQPRFVSWNNDTTQFFNHNAALYDLLPAERTHYFVKRNYPLTGAVPDNAFQWCNEQINKSHSFEEGKRHPYIVALVRYCNIKGVPEHETLTGSLQFIQPDFPEKEIESIVHSIYTKQVNSHAKLPFTKKPINPNHRPLQQPNQPKPPQTELKQPQPKEIIQISEINPFEQLPNISAPQPPEPNTLQEEISELENYFNSIPLPTFPISIKQGETIIDVSKSILSELAGAKNYSGNKRLCLTYLDPLRELKQYLICH